jgi:hypothetical protein
MKAFFPPHLVRVLSGQKLSKKIAEMFWEPDYSANQWSALNNSCVKCSWRQSEKEILLAATSERSKADKVPPYLLDIFKSREFAWENSLAVLLAFDDSGLTPLAT